MSICFFLLTMVSALIWSTIYLGELLIADTSTMILLAKFEYINVSLISFFWFMFCARYTGRAKKSQREILHISCS